ncbi:hypothetical protein ACFQ08_08095 [Streptosporangium algeriense]|uniref:Peptidase inhibitor family I36 n=1 Tax=Streptosporangium algeriense TaxID=1682748 RepID=A0ABW3DNF9_9ACTN
MRGVTSMAVSLAIVGLATILPTGQAWAEDTPTPAPVNAPADGPAKDAVTPENLTAADGYFYAAEHPYGGGKYCRWFGDDTSWKTCSDAGGNQVNMENRASQMFNNGFPGGHDDVRVYWGPGYTGAWRCLATGNHWDDLPLGRETFNKGSGLSGYGQSINDNVASHQWVSSC